MKKILCLVVVSIILSINTATPVLAKKPKTVNIQIGKGEKHEIPQKFMRFIDLKYIGTKMNKTITYDGWTNTWIIE
jgi:hypothetical protein